MRNKKDIYKELGGDFIAEDELEEQAEEEGLEPEEVKRKHFEEDDLN